MKTQRFLDISTIIFKVEITKDFPGEGPEGISGQKWVGRNFWRPSTSRCSTRVSASPPRLGSLCSWNRQIHRSCNGWWLLHSHSVVNSFEAMLDDSGLNIRTFKCGAQIRGMESFSFWGISEMHVAPWIFSSTLIHHRGVLSAQTYKVGWMGLKSLNASLVRAPLCGAKSTVERSWSDNPPHHIWCTLATGTPTCSGGSERGWSPP